jgi:hypothetical protein
VKIQQDLGATVDIASGVGPSDRVIDSPPDSLEDGQPVKISHPAAAAKQEG